MSNSRDMTGALFRIPDEDKKNDRWPDMRGDLTIAGVKYKLAGWTKQDKNGKKYLALTAKPAEEQQQQRPAEPPANAYAQAKGRSEPQRQQDRGGPDFGGDHIPFAPEWR
jgi:hypothetical protein